MTDWDYILRLAISEDMSIGEISRVFKKHNSNIRAAIRSRPWAREIKGYLYTRKINWNVRRPLIILGRKKSPRPPQITPSGSYDREDLGRFMSEAMREGLTDYQIAAVLKIEKHRAIYLM